MEESDDPNPSRPTQHPTSQSSPPANSSTDADADATTTTTTTTMSISTLPSYANYDLYTLCGPYPSPFFVHIFMGEVPQVIDWSDPYEIPSWVGQNAIYPNKPLTTSAAAPAAAAATVSQPPPSEHHNLTASEQEEWDAYVARVAQNPGGLTEPLPATFTTGGVRSSYPLTDAVVKKFNVSAPAELSYDAVKLYLAQHLQWRLVGVGDHKQISVLGVPVRFWVVKTDVIPPASIDEFPKYGAKEVVWPASRGKLGGLRPGELPDAG